MGNDTSNPEILAGTDAHSEFTPEELDLLIEGPIWKAIASQSVPQMLNALAISAATFADAYVAGKLGPGELAAVGIGGQIWFGMIIMAIAIAAGANALVSRFWGARDRQQALEAARQSIFSAVVFGFLSALIGFCFTDVFLRLLGATPEVAQKGSMYLRIQFIGQLPLTLLWVCQTILRARGETVLPTAIMAMVTVTVIILDLVLCLLTPLGITGIGISWLASSTLGCILMLFAFKKSELGKCLEISARRPFDFSLAWVRRIMAIGVPVCIQDLIWVGSNFGLFCIFALTGSATNFQAAWAVGLRVEDVLAGLPITAMSLGVATVVGQNLGAKKLDRATSAGWQAAGFGCALMVLVGALMYIFAGPIAGTMTSDHQVWLAARDYLQILGIAEPLQVTWLVLFGAMEGAGYTRIPMLFTLLCYALVKLPLAYLFAVVMGYGAAGAWLAMAVSFLVGTIFAVFWYKHGSWKHHQI